MKKAYLLLNAHSPGELSEKYTEEDQKLMRTEKWDYKDSTLVTNKIRNILERLDLNKLSKEEKFWRLNILWFWYHHAMSCALWRYHDRKLAQEYSKKAMKYQTKNHPNKITRIFYFLVHDQLRKAELWNKTITKEPEQSTAQHLIEEYKINGFFKTPS